MNDKVNQQVKLYDDNIEAANTIIRECKRAEDGLYATRKAILQHCRFRNKRKEMPSEVTREWLYSNMTVTDRRRLTIIHEKIANAEKKKAKYEAKKALVIAKENELIALCKKQDDIRRSKIALGVIPNLTRSTRDMMIASYREMAKYMMPGEYVSYIDVHSEHSTGGCSIVMERVRNDANLNVTHAEKTFTAELAELIVAISKCKSEAYADRLIENVYDVRDNMLSALNGYILFDSPADAWKDSDPIYLSAMKKNLSIEGKVAVLNSQILNHKAGKLHLKEGEIGKIRYAIRLLKNDMIKIDTTPCVISPILIEMAKRIIKQK